MDNYKQMEILYGEQWKQWNRNARFWSTEVKTDSAAEKLGIPIQSTNFTAFSYKTALHLSVKKDF